NVMMLIVSPSELKTMMEVRMARGIETTMMVVLRQLPRKIRIIIPVRQAAIDASVTTPLMAPFTKMDWSAKVLISSCGGTVVLINGNRALIPAMMVRVDVSPLFCTVNSEERCPFTRTMFVCGGKPSRTQATSLI